ncbi:uncharacterized protein MONBRDRAFT_12161 [Monosiga brevicollis MX1]|uniref:Rhodanese domain-containing protein n=1 Tax=Monosiga brevicollis TaxID=81824 RepID=A9VBE4_MONBE|nr:uncharacterized protein MONBRDRAFT_12161 [Monosiga brevicollis MX1]EDQ85222.1 predicted protein [Monosiga brevicollis MX1]|eukprot:XP_001750047.1 hypothetical protein [Monosiga brevicollis MX1]
MSQALPIPGTTSLALNVSSLRFHSRCPCRRSILHLRRSELRRLAIGADTHVVVYDCSDYGVFSAPRLWWTLRCFGINKVSVLNGGLRRWSNLGLPTTDSASEPTPAPLDTTEMKNPAELRALFEEAGIQLDRPLVATCGSGVTACMLAFGRYLVDGTEIPVYDGAWTEWASSPREQCPIATDAK